MYSVTKSSFLLLVMVVGFALSAEDLCPPPTEIYPCKCDLYSYGINIRCFAEPYSFDPSAVNTKAVQNVIKRLSGKNKDQLYVYGYDLDQAPTDLFNSLTIKRKA